MQTDTHIEVISPYHCYDCSRHTSMNFYNYESPCQMMVNSDSQQRYRRGSIKILCEMLMS